jgi:formylglycine-generating enzyme required for sulfatase activity
MPIKKTDIKPGEAWLEPVTGMKFVWVPGGCFQMGSSNPEGQAFFLDELPEHTVCVDGFWMGSFEVTNAQFRKFNPGHDSQDYQGLPLNMDDQPVVNVSWEEAKEFTWWLSNQNNARGGFRLPTEAEWEYACRAGSTGDYYWGLEIDARYLNLSDVNDPTGPSSEYIDDGHAVSAPVGSYLPNYFGLYDMLGNVWEWCEDRYSQDAYKRHQRNNPINTLPDETWLKDVRVGRGGGWRSHSGLVRCGGRGGAPGLKSISLGFRVVRRY